MLTYGVTDIQNKPSLIKMMDVAEIIDRRAHTTLGYFISSKYEKQIRPLIEKIDREEKLLKLIPTKYHAMANHVMVLHGRYICKALKPKCADCPVARWCTAKDKNI